MTFVSLKDEALRKIKIMPGEEGKPEEKKKLKPCCACPETKRARDTW